MTAAVIAAIVAVLVTAVLICVALAVYRGTRGNKVRNSGHRVDSIRTLNYDSKVKNTAGTDARMGDNASPTSQGGNLEKRYQAASIVSLAVLGALAVKTFILQVVDGQKYAEESDNNQYTTVTTPAPRGVIYDRGGVALVRNRSCQTVLADADVIDSPDVIARLSAVLSIPRNIIRQRIQDSTVESQAQRVIASDVRFRDMAFISEHSDAFSGISIETRTVREYPYAALAAHVLGYTGTADEDDIKALNKDRLVKSGDDIGKSGMEYTYDNVLAGDHGVRTMVTDASGNTIREVSETQPVKGNDVYLTLDAQVQYKADTLLKDTIAPEDNAIGSGKGTSGAIVVMDVTDGSIVALASYPTYDPSEFVGGISTDTWSVYNSDSAYNPLMNRAITGTYPAASTFKAFTGMAGLRYGFATGESTWNCTGEWDGWDTGEVQKCWYKYGHGTLDLREGMIQSCDVVFYEMAKEFFDNRTTVGNTAMQDEVMKYGFGSLTNIDLEGEASGRVPTPDWKKEYFKDVPEESSWKGGDLTNMVIGQGYVLITPIQLAVGYGAIATGKMMRPHLLREVRNTQGKAVASFTPEVLGEPDVRQEDLEYIRDSLHGAAMEGSVSYLFTQAGLDAAAKTGTGEVETKGDYAWSVCYGPYDSPKYVAVVLIEEGGGGSSVAMPIAVQMLKAAIDADAGELDCGVGSIPGSTGKVVEHDFTSEGRED